MQSSAIRQIRFILAQVARLLWDTDKKLLLLTIFSSAFSSTLIIPTVYLDKIFLDTLIQNIGKSSAVQAFNFIVLIVVARFFIQFFKDVLGLLDGYWSRMLNLKLNKLVETRLGEKYARITVGVIEDPEFKDRYNLIERESLSRLGRLASLFTDIPQFFTGMISSLVIFVFTQPFIVLVTLLTTIPSLLADRKFAHDGYEVDKAINPLHKLRGSYYYFLSRSRGYMELRLVGVYQYLVDKISGLWDEIIAKRFEFEKSRRLTNIVAGLPNDMFAYFLDGFFAFQALLGKITIGAAQANIRAISNFQNNFSSFTSSFIQLYENYLYVSDLVWFLNLEVPYYSQQGSPFVPAISGGIKFSDVWFKYPGSDNWILKGVNLTITPHENVALIGENGAGKTTLVKLLCGFYPPTKGGITIDGQDINGFYKPDYWLHLAVLFQDFETYFFSARESIGFGNISKINDLDYVRHYAKLADVDEWITSLPLGYENPLSRDLAKGIIPSGGQWQKIGIARTLAKDAPIIILDEPTSNVDPQAEEDIFNHILKLGKDKILVFISHRFSTVRRADKILLLENGVITEQGTHDQLLKHKGRYSQLFALQAKNYR